MPRFWSPFPNGAVEVQQNLYLFEEELRAKAEELGVRVSELLQTYAREHHKWEPQTGMTDETTEAHAEFDGEEVVVHLSAGMPYDVFLELGMNGNWTWLYPTLVDNQTAMLDMMIEMLGEMELR